MSIFANCYSKTIVNNVRLIVPGPPDRSVIPCPSCPHNVGHRWRRGVAVERRTRDREVVGSSLDRALRRKNSGQVSHT